MSVEDIKKGIASLSPQEQTEVSAYLFQLRQRSNDEYQNLLEERLADKNPGNWLTPEDFEKRLDQK